ncbi:MAG: hypothetical protein FD166_1381 [Bacteroidetes bacterium]|nr:MAG: hypothetical protein FD166_1381 [Bacteroidota bacterium]
MENDIHSPEQERILLENQKLKREIEHNFEQQRLDIEKSKIEEERDRQKRDYKRNLTSSVLTAFSILVTAIITIISFLSTRSTNDATNRINEETLLLTKLERIDKLKSEFDDSLATLEHKSSIAYELIRDSLLLSQYDRERLIRYYQSFLQLENARREINSKQDKINSRDLANLKRAELNLILLENQLSTEENEGKRTKIRQKINALTEELRVTKETRAVVKQMDTLNQVQKEITGNGRNSPLIAEQVTWLKVGYYRPFGEIMVTLEQLNELQGSGLISVSGQMVNTKKQQMTFSVPGIRTAIFNDQTYEFRFIKIDRAGKNPLTKAVYFSLKAQPKKQNKNP